MTAIRLGVFLMLAALAAAQSSTLSSIPEPKLPVVERDACPRAVAFHVKLEKDVRMYSSWQEKRTLVGTLKAGGKVTVLAGVNIIREPDRAVVTHPLVHAVVTQPLVQAPASLKPGEVILRYGLNKYDYWNFWAKGAWFTEYIDQVVEKSASCDFPDERDCYVKILGYGLKEWWLQVKTRSGRTGWVLATEYGVSMIWALQLLTACAQILRLTGTDSFDYWRRLWRCCLAVSSLRSRSAWISC